MCSSKPKILLLSAYDAASHRHWRRWLADTFNEFEWTSLSLPDRHFYWRIRSNALTYVSEHAQALEQHYDLIIATSMTDLGMLRALRPQLATIPTIVYYHENQFAYPLSESQAHRSNIINAQLNTFFSGLCADKLVFNSHYNLETFLSGATDLFRRMPDGVDAELVEDCRQRSVVLPVPVITGVEPRRSAVIDSKSPLAVVWNHRWEYDKQPEVFFDAMAVLAADGLDFRLHVVGQQFRNTPACFKKAEKELRDYIVTWGHQPQALYYQILNEADIIVSTALHDFQGLSMLEAIHRGCVPVAPNRVAYPEYIPEQMLYDPKNEVHSLTSILRQWLTFGVPECPSLNGYLDHQLTDNYRALFGEFIN